MVDDTPKTGANGLCQWPLVFRAIQPLVETKKEEDSFQGRSGVKSTQWRVRNGQQLGDHWNIGELDMWDSSFKKLNVENQIQKVICSHNYDDHLLNVIYNGDMCTAGHADVRVWAGDYRPAGQAVGGSWLGYVFVKPQEVKLVRLAQGSDQFDSQMQGVQLVWLEAFVEGKWMLVQNLKFPTPVATADVAQSAQVLITGPIGPDGTVVNVESPKKETEPARPSRSEDPDWWPLRTGKPLEPNPAFFLSPWPRVHRHLEPIPDEPPPPEQTTSLAPDGTVAVLITGPIGPDGTVCEIDLPKKDPDPRKTLDHPTLTPCEWPLVYRHVDAVAPRKLVDDAPVDTGPDHPFPLPGPIGPDGTVVSAEFLKKDAEPPFPVEHPLEELRCDWPLVYRHVAPTPPRTATPAPPEPKENPMSGPIGQVFFDAEIPRKETDPGLPDSEFEENLCTVCAYHSLAGFEEKPCEDVPIEIVSEHPDWWPTRTTCEVGPLMNPSPWPVVYRKVEPMPDPEINDAPMASRPSSRAMTGPIGWTPGGPIEKNSIGQAIFEGESLKTKILPKNSIAHHLETLDNRCAIPPSEWPLVYRHCEPYVEDRPVEEAPVNTKEEDQMLITGPIGAVGPHGHALFHGEKPKYIKPLRTEGKNPPSMTPCPWPLLARDSVLHHDEDEEVEVDATAEVESDVAPVAPEVGMTGPINPITHLIAMTDPDGPLAHTLIAPAMTVPAVAEGDSEKLKKGTIFTETKAARKIGKAPPPSIRDTVCSWPLLMRDVDAAPLKKINPPVDTDEYAVKEDHPVAILTGGQGPKGIVGHVLGHLGGRPMNSKQKEDLIASITPKEELYARRFWKP